MGIPSGTSSACFPHMTPLGVLKRTIVPDTVACEATVGRFRDANCEDIVLSFENSLQLLHLSNGMLQDGGRQILDARAKDMAALTISNQGGVIKVRFTSVKRAD